MALGNDSDREFWAAFAVFQASALHRRRQQLCVIAELEGLEADVERALRRSQELVMAVAARYSSERSVWACPRETSWYETTLPHLPDHVFRENPSCKLFHVRLYNQCLRVHEAAGHEHAEGHSTEETCCNSTIPPHYLC